MEYLEGETLEAKLRKGAIPYEQALLWAIQIAEAVDQAHRAGVLHRDLKPGNIMITKSGVKLLDFGLARRVFSSGALSLTEDGTHGPQCNAVVAVVCPRPDATPQQVKEVTPLLNKASATTAVACPICDHHFSLGWYF